MQFLKVFVSAKKLSLNQLSLKKRSDTERLKELFYFQKPLN